MALSWVVRAGTQGCGAGRGFPKRGVLLAPRASWGWIWHLMLFPGVQSSDFVLSSVIICSDYLLGAQYLCLIFPCLLLLMPRNCLDDGNSQSQPLTTVCALTESLNFKPDWLVKLQLHHWMDTSCKSCKVCTWGITALSDVSIIYSFISPCYVLDLWKQTP